MARIFRSVEVADDSRPSGREREGSSRLLLLLQVGETPLRDPPTTEVVRGRIEEVQNLCHPLSTEGKVVKRNSPLGCALLLKKPMLAIIMSLVFLATRTLYQPSCCSYKIPKKNIIWHRIYVLNGQNFCWMVVLRFLLFPANGRPYMQWRSLEKTHQN